MDTTSRPILIIRISNFLLLMSIVQGMQQLNNNINKEYVATDQLIAGA